MSAIFDPAMLMTMTCSIEHSTMTGTPDDYGDPTKVTTITTSKCWIAQSSRTEDPNAMVEQDKWNLYLPAGTPIDANDGVVCQGQHYEVFGNPWHSFHPAFGADWQVEVTLHRTE